MACKNSINRQIVENTGMFWTLGFDPAAQL
jgi:hypothetical protein